MSMSIGFWQLGILILLFFPSLIALILCLILIKKRNYKKIPKNIDYDDIHGLSIEAKQLLSENKPENLSQASRISGITPSTISIIMVYLKKNKIGLNKEKTSKVA